MAKLCLKKPSKRISCKRRYKIEKKVRQHNKKKRREAKKVANKPSKKLIHVPNICPFKESILNDAKEYKEQMKAQQQAMWEQMKEENAPKDLNDLVVQAQAKQNGLDEPGQNGGGDEDQRKDSSKQHKTFYREFQKVVAAADVILEVVDSRDPLGTRCPTVEKTVRESGDGKRLVLVLNKADLVPREILQKWLKYLRRSVPCIPFKSSTQKQNQNLGRKKLMKKKEIESGGMSVGAEGLTSLLGNYTRNKGIKTSIRVGVVGLPNVGKSSLINTLKRSRACKVGGVPGVTRSLQEIQLDSKIKLLDSPGLAFAGNSDPHAALKNAVVSSDSVEPAEMVLARAQRDQLMKLYLVPSYETATEFLTSLAKRYGRYKRGGVPDVRAAAKILVDDWNKGKIEYYTDPPEETTDHEISSAIVTEEVAEFNLEEYDRKIFSVPEESMDVDGAKSDTASTSTFVVAANKKRRKKKERGRKEVPDKKFDSLMEMEGNQKLNKLVKLKFKKMKKQKARERKKGINVKMET